MFDPSAVDDSPFPAVGHVGLGWLIQAPAEGRSCLLSMDSPHVHHTAGKDTQQITASDQHKLTSTAYLPLKHDGDELVRVEGTLRPPHNLSHCFRRLCDSEGNINGGNKDTKTGKMWCFSGDKT